MGNLEIIHPTEKMSLLGLDDLLMYVGSRAPTAETVRWLEQQVIAQKAAHKGVYMHVLLPDKARTTVTEDSTRVAMQHFVKAVSPQFLSAAIVLGYEGFLGATVRSIFSAVLFAARPEIPVKMFAEAEEATK